MSKLLPTDSEGSKRGDGEFMEHHLNLPGTKAPYYKTGTFKTLVQGVSLLRVKYQVCLFNPEQFLSICFHFGSEELSSTSKVKFSIFVLFMHNHFRYLILKIVSLLSRKPSNCLKRKKKLNSAILKVTHAKLAVFLFMK